MFQDLLDAVTKEYSSMGLNKPSSSLQKAAGGKNDYEQADASSFLQGNYDNYHSHSTSNQGLAIARPLSASGTATTYSSSTVNSERGGNSYSFSNTDAFSRDSPIHLERSQSAAPTFLSPPPGLGGSGVRNQMADPNDFFRVSRGMTLRLNAIQKIHPHLNGRLKIETNPAAPEDVFVSRERVGEFKSWLGGS